MATKQAQPTVQLSTSESVGTFIGTAQDAHIGVVRGYRAARNPALVEARATVNEARVDAITAKLLADLQQ